MMATNNIQRSYRSLPGHSVRFFAMNIILCVLLLTKVTSAFSSIGPSRMMRNQDSGNRELIVNGVLADTTKFSYFALTANDLYDTTRDDMCGAALIHSDILLTSAHCHGLFNYGVRLYNPSTLKFDRIVKIVEQWRHPNFNLDNSNFNWDYLIMRLEEPVKDIQPVLLNSNPNVPSTDELLTAIGFGAKAYEENILDELYSGELQYMLPEDCEDKITSVPITGAEIGDELLCAGSTSAGNSVCMGDSGGPLLTATSNGILVGITSWTLQCNVDDLPDGFARISTAYDWIQETICQISKESPATCSGQTTTPSTDMFEMRLDVRYDFSPEDTTFAIRNIVSGEIEYAGPTYVISDRESKSIWSSTFYLAEGNYQFEVYDREENGMGVSVHPEALGAWQLYAKQNSDSIFNLVATGDHLFEEESITSFLLPSALPPSTPTLPPAGFPTTEAPSTLPPSMSPMELQPTVNPLTSPAKEPMKSVDSGKSNTGVVVGSVVAVLVLLLGGGFFYYIRFVRPARMSNTPSESNQPDTEPELPSTNKEERSQPDTVLQQYTLPLGSGST